VATSLNNLAALYDSQGAYARAEPLYQRALAISEKVLGPEHPQVATSLNNLAALYDSQGAYARAEPLYQRALAIREKVLGPEHPSVATTQGNIGFLYLAQGKLAQAYAIFKGKKGSTGLGRYYLLTRDYQAARDQFQPALAYFQTTRESDHLLASYIGLGLALEGLQQYPEAAQVYRQAVELMEEQRAALAPASRTHFLQGQVGAGFQRILAYEGLVRTQSKRQDPADAFFWAEHTKARVLLEALARGASPVGLPPALAQQEETLTTRLQGLYRQREVAFAHNPELFTQIEAHDLPQVKQELA
jgi:tetratricopeptide (TPR) repeat protein